MKNQYVPMKKAHIKWAFFYKRTQIQNIILNRIQRPIQDTFEQDTERLQMQERA